MSHHICDSSGPHSHPLCLCCQSQTSASDVESPHTQPIRLTTISPRSNQQFITYNISFVLYIHRTHTYIILKTVVKHCCMIKMRRIVSDVDFKVCSFCRTHYYGVTLPSDSFCCIFLAPRSFRPFRLVISYDNGFIIRVVRINRCVFRFFRTL